MNVKFVSESLCFHPQRNEILKIDIACLFQCRLINIQCLLRLVDRLEKCVQLLNLSAKYHKILYKIENIYFDFKHSKGKAYEKQVFMFRGAFMVLYSIFIMKY